MAWLGIQTTNDDLRESTVTYANGLADVIETAMAGNGHVGGGVDNQAATQGVVGQGLLWASQLDGVDRRDAGRDVLSYLTEVLFDDDAGTFASGADAETYHITTRDAGDITGGLNAADVLLDMDIDRQYARFFNQTFNRGRLQRAERGPSHHEDAEYPLPLPPNAGGEFGQAAVYNTAVEYDVADDVWTVVDEKFETAPGFYLANQQIWLSQWGNEFYPGRGVPGKTDTPP